MVPKTRRQPKFDDSDSQKVALQDNKLAKPIIARF
jgi:hypothetical protein